MLFSKSQNVESLSLRCVYLLLIPISAFFLCLLNKSNVFITPLGRGVNAVSRASMETLQQVGLMPVSRAPALEPHPAASELKCDCLQCRS